MYLDEMISPSDLSLVQQALAAESTTLSLAYIHGFITAIASSPKITPPSIWLEILLGKTKSQATSQALLNLYLLTLNKLQLNQPLSAKKEMLAIDLRPWCQGYLAWIDQDHKNWLHNHGKQELAQLLNPLLILASTYEQFTSQNENKKIGEPQYLKLCLEATIKFKDNIYKIYAFWKKHQHCTHHHNKPIVHPRKINRNALCHCGSDKKFKKCCGINT